MEQTERAALHHAAANNAARQQAEADRLAKQPPGTEAYAPPKTDMQPEAGVVSTDLEVTPGLDPKPNSGWGQERPKDTYEELKAIEPLPEPVPLPNSGWGQERPQGTYDELKAATPASEPEPQTSADAEISQPEPALPVQEGQESAEQPAPMTARQRHEARLQSFIQGDQQDRQAAKEELAGLTEGTEAAIEEVLELGGLGVSGPHLGGGISR